MLPPMSEMKRLQISMDDALFSALRRYAEEAGVSMAQAVRQCLLAEFGPNIGG
jgi:hypothetical protein